MTPEKKKFAPITSLTDEVPVTQANTSKIIHAYTTHNFFTNRKTNNTRKQNDAAQQPGRKKGNRSKIRKRTSTINKHAHKNAKTQKHKNTKTQKHPHQAAMLESMVNESLAREKGWLVETEHLKKSVEDQQTLISRHEKQHIVRILV